MNVIPINDLIIIEVIDDPTLGGLVDGTDSSEGLGIGLVRKKGPGYITKLGTIPISAEINEQILFILDSATKFTYEDKEYVIVRENDTSAIMDKEVEFNTEEYEWDGLNIDEIIDDMINNITGEEDPDK